MKIFFLAMLFAALSSAQTLTFYLDNSNGATPTSQLTSLPSPYQFSNTPVGGSTRAVIRVVNSSSAAVSVAAIFVGVAPNSPVATANFTVTGFPSGLTLAPQQWQLFTLNYTPASTGTSYGYLQAEANNAAINVATVYGAGVAPQFQLTCSGVATQCNGSTLQPNNSTPINFGNIATTQSGTITFSLTNTGTTSLNPSLLISLAAATNNPNIAFTLSALPATLAAQTTMNFVITFAPGTATTFQSGLLIGSNEYLLQGAGTASVVGDISSLVVTYVDSTGVRLTAQPATAINFGQTVSGSNTSSTFTFTVANPSTTISAVTIPSLSVSGSAFSLTGSPAIPTTIQPGQSTTFQIVFSASALGTYTGTLAVGSRQFALTGQSITSPLPEASLQVDLQPLTSQQQAHLTIQLASASTVSAIGQLTMQFTPSVTNVSDDPSINFVATSGRNLQVNVATGASTATYNNQSSITFQTGTTAGTITFSVAFPNKATLTKSFTISPAQVAVTAQGVRQSPNLVLTLTGYDNTYSAGQLSFTFYDTSGKILTPNAIQVNAASSFQQYFFTNNQAGGAFSLQASFPVNGDVTQVGSVAASLTNSAGTASVNQSFQ